MRSLSEKLESHFREWMSSFSWNYSKCRATYCQPISLRKRIKALRRKDENVEFTCERIFIGDKPQFVQFLLSHNKFSFSTGLKTLSPLNYTIKLVLQVLILTKD